MIFVNIFFTVTIMISSFSASAKDLLTYGENVVLCETILDLFSGDDTTGFIHKYSHKYGYHSTKDFLEENAKEHIFCSNRSLINFTLDRGHDDDIKAFIDAGINPNDLIKDSNGRKMTMLDYVMNMYRSSDDSNEKETIKAKIKVIRKAGGRTCSQLRYTDCVF